VAAVTLLTCCVPGRAATLGKDYVIVDECAAGNPFLEQADGDADCEADQHDAVDVNLASDFCALCRDSAACVAKAWLPETSLEAAEQGIREYGAFLNLQAVRGALASQSA
jgi:hypothetical protein